MKYAYILTHTRELPNDDEDVHYIGIYSTKRKAKIARKRASILPEFSDCIEGFFIDYSKLNRSGWIEGFITYSPGDDWWS